MANQAVHKRISNIEELIGRSHAILEERLIRLESLLMSDPARASMQETTLMWQLLYGAVARFGLSGTAGEIAAIQLPLLAVPVNHTLIHQKDEATGLIRISIIATDSAQVPSPDADEGLPTTEETSQDTVPATDPAAPTESPSGLIIEPQDAPFIDEQEAVERALEAEMTAGVREE